jgi:uncharacterized membrane protein
MASPTPGQTNLGVAPNVGGLLCYVPCCIGLIFSIVVAIVEKQSRFVRFHAFQSLLLHAAWFVLGLIIQILSMALSYVAGFLGFLVSLFAMVLGLGMLGLCIYLMIRANANEEIELPVIGEMARKWA